jgi:hypothetical protein
MIFPQKTPSLFGHRNWLFATLLLGTTSLSAAAPPCFETLRRLKEPGQDSSVELELPITPKVMGLVTTLDGTLKPLLKRKKLSAETARLLGIKSITEARKIRWDSVSTEVKIHLINQVSKRRDFQANRVIPELKLRDQIYLKFFRPTEFMGVKYPAGSFPIDPREFLVDKVEYGNEQSVGALDQFELHFRTPQSAGTNSNDAWKFLSAVGVPRSYQHVHMVAGIPIEELKEDTDFESFRVTDFIRRANLLAEMFSITGLIPIKDQGVMFGHMKAQYLSGIQEYFQKAAKGKAPDVEHDFKLAWVAFRGSDTYDAEGLWGLEFRAITEEDNPAVVGTVLDALQYSMIERDYGISPTRLKDWKKSHESLAIEELWYDQEYGHLKKAASPQVKEALRNVRMDKIGSLTKKNAAVKMLIHDWSKDPIFFGRPDHAEKVSEAQAKALKQILSNPKDSEKALRQFVLESDLLRQVLSSLKIPQPAQILSLLKK